MEINTIIDGLEKLETASLYRTPNDLTKFVDSWKEEFENMPEKQFMFAINEIRKKETIWPPVAIIYRYAENWPGSNKINALPWSESDGISKKMTADNRRRIDGFLERIG